MLVACGPRRALPTLDPATGAPIDRTRPDGRPSGDVALRAENLQSGAGMGEGDDRRVSRSRGSAGGIVLLWPRIVPSERSSELAEVAGALQSALFQAIRRRRPGRAIDIRPAPQRVCPQAGCVASSVGVLLVSSRGGCAAVVQTARPGRGAVTQTPWAGRVKLRHPTVPFRSPPESFVRIHDFVPCGRLVDALDGRLGQVERAIAALP